MAFWWFLGAQLKWLISSYIEVHREAHVDTCLGFQRSAFSNSKNRVFRSKSSNLSSRIGAAIKYCDCLSLILKSLGHNNLSCEFPSYHYLPESKNNMDFPARRLVRERFIRKGLATRASCKNMLVPTVLSHLRNSDIENKCSRNGN